MERQVKKMFDQKLLQQAIESAKCRIYRLKVNQGESLAHQMKTKNQIELQKITVAALKKQIPIKADEDDCCPLCNTYGKDDNGVEGYYCPNCGQRLKWGV